MLCFVQGFETKDGVSAVIKQAKDGPKQGASKDGLKEGASKDGKEARLQVVKNKLMIRKSRSSGNFGSAGTGARSAPTTPAGTGLGAGVPPPLGGGVTSPLGIAEQPPSQPCSPPPSVTAASASAVAAAAAASSAIHRSPSHSLFTTRDKSTLKHLSTSTPAMTAQAQLAEPPSPKLIKEAKVPTTSKARQKKFHRHFPAVDDDEKVLNYYSCALIGDILLQGHLYITKNYFAFYSNVFGYVTKLLIPMLSVEKITKEKTARIIPNAVGIATSEDKHVFGSLMSRDSTYRYMTKVWELARDDALQVLLEPEIVEPAVSDSDSSAETREGESGGESPAVALRPRVAVRETPLQTRDDHLSKSEAGAALALAVVRQRLGALAGLRAVPRQSALLLATTLLLILLFLSAAVLLYRIDRVQTRYRRMLPDLAHHHHHHHQQQPQPQPPQQQQQHHQTVPQAPPEGDHLYGDLLHWQTQLHSESAGAVQNFLDANLDQIAKVRQSLEALSTLLVSTENSNNNNNNNSPATQQAGTDRDSS